MDKLSLKLKVYEGPLDLLLHLIKKNKVDIYDIPISEITNQYIRHLNNMKTLNLEIASEFIVMAARLLYIKSKMLLPIHTESEESDSDFDPRSELVERLIEYKQYKEVSLLLKQKEKKYKNIYYKHAEPIDIKYDISRYLDVSINDLMQVFNRLILKSPIYSNNKKEKIIVKIKRDKISIKKKSAEILKNIIANKEINFIDLFKGLNNKEELVANFLALLELIRFKKIIVQKNKANNKILLRINNTKNGDTYGN